MSDLPHAKFLLCFQGTRHTFFEEVGRGMSNPTVMLLAATHMLAHVHLDYHAQIIQRAVEKVIKLGKVCIAIYFHS